MCKPVIGLMVAAGLLLVALVMDYKDNQAAQRTKEECVLAISEMDFDLYAKLRLLERSCSSVEGARRTLKVLKQEKRREKQET